MAEPVRLRDRFTTTAEVVGLGLLPAALLVGVLAAAARSGDAYGVEFRSNLYDPAGRILSGRSPYEPARLAATFARHGFVAQAVYPALAHVAAVPLRLLPVQAAFALYMALAVGAIVCALRLLGVCDWRCYGAAFLTVPVLQGLKLGGLTPFLVLGAAAAWRYRDRRWAGAVAAALLVAVKLFLWPLLIWLLVAGRRGAAARAALVAAGASLAGWAVIGFEGLTDYPHLLSALAAGEQTRGYSTVSVVAAAGLSQSLGRLVAATAGVTLLGCAWRARDDERLGFTLALLASLVLTPIVWQQYFALLLVPVALARPSFSGRWLVVPFLFWLAPVEGHSSRDLLTAWGAAAAAVAIVLLARGQERLPGSSPQPS